MKLKLNLLLLLLCGASLVPLFAQDEGPDLPTGIQEERDPGIVRSRGDQVFSFNAGLIIPLFFSDTDLNFTSGTENLSLGGVGSLEWSSHINQNVVLGGQLSGMFAITVNERTLSMIPICFKAGYIFNFHPITITPTMTAGFSFNTLDDLFEFTPIVKPGATVLWNINPDWSVGFNANYWWVPEFHINDLASQTRFGNFLETSFSASYYF